MAAYLILIYYVYLSMHMYNTCIYTNLYMYILTFIKKMYMFLIFICNILLSFYPEQGPQHTRMDHATACQVPHTKQSGLHCAMAVEMRGCMKIKIMKVDRYGLTYEQPS